MISTLHEGSKGTGRPGMVMPDSLLIHSGTMIGCKVHSIKGGEWNCHLEAVCQPLSCRKDPSSGGWSKRGLREASYSIRTRHLEGFTFQRLAIVERSSQRPLYWAFVHRRATAVGKHSEVTRDPKGDVTETLCLATLCP